MASSSGSNWRHSLGAAERYDNVERLTKIIQLNGLTSTGNEKKFAFATETDAYNTSESRGAYNAAINAVITEVPAPPSRPSPEPESPGITIGSYTNCHYIASGLISEVYRSGTVALKVITKDHNVDPHNPAREVKILSKLAHTSIIKLRESFRDREGRLTLVFPYMPLTLAMIIASGEVPKSVTRSAFHDLFSALANLHEKGIIHRDIKPSNVLLASSAGPAYLADFGTAWDPEFSISDEPADHKVLDVGTTCYRTPETLFGNRSYNSSHDMWATGTMLAEAIRKPPEPLFQSRDTSEDGNQLGLILSIFKTVGTPTKETWPEASHFQTPPFEWYQDFPGHSWEELLPDVDVEARDLVRKLVCYESGERLSAVEALEHPYIKRTKSNT